MNDQFEMPFVHDDKPKKRKPRKTLSFDTWILPDKDFGLRTPKHHGPEYYAAVLLGETVIAFVEVNEHEDTLLVHCLDTAPEGTTNAQIKEVLDYALGEFTTIDFR